MTLTGIQLAEPLQPGSRAWLDTYSASQVAAIMGWSNWDTPRSIADKKLGVIPPQEQTVDQSRGHYWEPHIRQWVIDANPTWTVEETSTWRHNEREWQTADPDGMIFLPDGTPEGLEEKTDANLHTWGDQPPIGYQCQATWQMDTIGTRRTHIAACGPFELFHRRPKMFVIDYNPRFAAMLRERVMAFDRNLRGGILPAPDHTHKADREAMRYEHTSIVGTGKTDPGLEIPESLAVPFLEAARAATTVAEAKKTEASRLLQYLGDQKKAVYKGKTIATRVNGKGDNPPSLRAADGLADLATELLTDEKAVA